MVNKVLLIGNLGKEPESRTAGSSSVCSFTLATSEKIKKNEEWVTETSWHNVVVWGKQADFVQKYIKKGDMVYVEGKIKSRSYDDKDGNKKYITEIVAYEIKSLSFKKEDSGIPQP
jgi:single-strand DNA-binding protein